MGAKEREKWARTYKMWCTAFLEQLSEESHLVPLGGKLKMHKIYCWKSFNHISGQIGSLCKKMRLSSEYPVKREEKVAWTGRQIQILLSMPKQKNLEKKTKTVQEHSTCNREKTSRQ